MAKRKIVVVILFILGIICIMYYKGYYKNLFKKNIKTVVFGTSTEPVTLDPSMEYDSESAKVMVNIYDSLVTYKENLSEVQPSLATSWTISDDGKEYVFHLRKGVKFHDNTKFNSYAVVCSVKRQLKLKDNKGNYYLKNIFDNIDEIRALSEYTLKVNLKRRDTKFLTKLANPYFIPIISPRAVEKYGDEYFKHPVGTGPFEFVEWNIGDSIILKRNKEYWGDISKVDRICFRFIKENSQRAYKFIIGDIDIADNLDSDNIIDIEKQGGKIIKTRDGNLNYIKFNAFKYPCNNKEFRKAISIAINKPDIMKKMYGGNSVGIQDDMRYNPKLSCEILQKINFRDSLKLKMMIHSNATSYNCTGEKLAGCVQENLFKIGIKSNVEVLSWDEYLSKKDNNNWDIVFGGCIGNEEKNNSQYEFEDNSVYCPICKVNLLTAYSNKISGVEYDSNGIIKFNKIYIK